MKKLSKEAFESTLTKPMVRVAMDAEPPVDIWPYFDEIPPEDFQGYDCSEGVVVFAYDNNQGTYQHILVNSDADKVYMIIVIDLQNNDILGHRLVSFAAQQNQA